MNETIDYRNYRFIETFDFRVRFRKHFFFLFFVRFFSNKKYENNFDFQCFIGFGHMATQQGQHSKSIKLIPDVVTSRTCQRWFKRFREGDFSLEDKPRSGRPQEVSNDELLKVVEENPRVTTEELAIMFDCSNSTIFEHLKSLGKKCKAGRWVPHTLTANNRAQRLSICTSLLLKTKKQTVS
mgnify:CR=1 FL=1